MLQQDELQYKKLKLRGEKYLYTKNHTLAIALAFSEMWIHSDGSTTPL